MALTEAEAFIDEAKQGKVKWRRWPEAPFFYRAEARMLLTAGGDDRTLDSIASGAVW